MIINAVSYARFSSTNQREASIEIQQESIARYCKDNNITLIREYVDRAMSATSDNRPSFQKMIKDAESGMFSFVIVYNSSRFCRNVQDHLKYRSILESYGVRLICVNENFDESTPEGDLMANFMMSINQFYSKDLGRKTYLGCLKTAKECKHVGGRCIYGYTIDQEQKYIINEEEAKVVKLVFDMLEKNVSYKEITNRLTAMGHLDRNGKPFKADFSRMGRCRKYIGEYSWNTGTQRGVSKHSEKSILGAKDSIIIPNGIPAIIKEDQFLRVQKILDERRKHRRESKNYLLAGLLTCGECGYKLCVDRNNNGNGKRNWVRCNYRCYSKSKNRAECSTKDIPVDNLDTYIINLLYNVLLNERYASNIHKLIRDKVGRDYEINRREIVELQVKIDKAKTEIKNLIQSLAEAKNVVYQEIVKEIERISNRKLELEKAQSLKKEQQESLPYYNEATIERSIRQMRKMLKLKTTEYIKPVLNLLIKDIVVSNKEIQIKVNLNAYISGKSGTQDLEVVIIEETVCIKDLEQQLRQRLNWNSLQLQI